MLFFVKKIIFAQLAHFDLLSSDILPVVMLSNSRGSRLEMFCKKGVLRNFAKFIRKHLFQSLFFNKIAGMRPATLLKKRLLGQVLSCEFCKISKNTFLYKTPIKLRVHENSCTVLIPLCIKNLDLPISHTNHYPLRK